MARKVFISFLGSNNYIPCNYYCEGSNEKVSNIRFIQEAILRIYCKDNNEEDVFYCFNTSLAEEKNWKNGLHYNPEIGKNVSVEGLESRIIKLKEAGGYQGQYKSIRIPEGFSSEEVWSTFEIMYNCIEENDCIILDVTHSFRSIPLLGAVLLNYAKSLKNVNIENICYGAFEKLGSAHDVKKINIVERNAPIINLNSLSELQLWNSAAEDFYEYGKVGKLISRTNENIRPILVESKGKDESARNKNLINRGLLQLTKLIESNRGRALEEFDYSNLMQQLENYKDDLPELTPLKELIDLIKFKIHPFTEKNFPKWFVATRWCIEHGLIQQGFTQLQEGIVTWAVLKFREITNDPYFDPNQESSRNFTGSLLSVEKISKEKWKGELLVNKVLANQLLEKYDLKPLRKIYSSLSDFRNDIHHGGWLEHRAPEKFEKHLREKIVEVEALISGNSNIRSLENKKAFELLVNFSNHPSKEWKADQKKAAIEKFDEICDVEMPVIDPNWSLDYIKEEARISYNKIIESAADKFFAVHCHGESAFIYNLISILESSGIPAFASTTQRKVKENPDGTRTYSFNFVKFRPYY